MPVRPTIFDGHVLALDITGVFEALTKSAQTLRVAVGRYGAEEPNHRHCLLRTRRERPRDGRAAEQRDELAAPQLIELHSVPAS